MTELFFKGKEFVYNHHLAVPHRPLVVDAAKSVGEPDLSGNLIIQGDNLHALKSLLPLYAGKVDCIFIDPPYNTGNEGWSYNDRVNAPMIKEWLDNNPVGVEDGLRHDKWCAMMWPRLKLLHELLAEDGVIFICIDDNEEPNLRLMMDEIFLRNNFLSNLIWDLGTGTTAGHFARSHEYLVVYAKNKESVANFEVPEEGSIRHGALKKISYKNPPSNIDFPAGVEFEGDNAVFEGTIGGSETQEIIDSKLIFENGRLKYPVKIRAGWAIKNQIIQWLNGEETFDTKGQKVIRIYFNKSGIVSYEKERTVANPKTVLNEFGSTKTGTTLVRNILNDAKFDYPKPLGISKNLISICSKPNALILDSFAGSGTTAHAVLKANAEDGGKRKFIMVEMEDDIADTVTAERTRRVIKGYGEGKKAVAGTGGAFTYCTLGEPVDLARILAGDTLPSYDEMAPILFHMATNETLNAPSLNADEFYVGQSQNSHLWMIYRPDLQWLKSDEAALTLSRAKAMFESDKDKQHLVFAPARFVSEKVLKEEGINVAFIPLPFSLYRFEKEI